MALVSKLWLLPVVPHNEVTTRVLIFVLYSDDSHTRCWMSGVYLTQPGHLWRVDSQRDGRRSLGVGRGRLVCRRKVNPSKQDEGKENMAMKWDVSFKEEQETVKWERSGLLAYKRASEETGHVRLQSSHIMPPLKQINVFHRMFIAIRLKLYTDQLFTNWLLQCLYL